MTLKSEMPARKLRLRTTGEGVAENPLALLSWQAKKGSDTWTRAEWTSLCKHLHNGNGPMQFVMAFRDGNGAKRYVRSKRLTVDRAISWAWSSISGSPKSKLAFAPYSTNDHQQSRWGGMDFDAHDGNADRARELALAAFRVLLNAPDLCIILETSGSGGWHVTAISPDFHNTSEWIRLLKSVVSTIGTVIADGVCEIFPPDSLPSRFGKPMRAPGCWNPATDVCSEILWENTRTSLASVLSGNHKNPRLISNGLQQHFPDTKKETSFSSSLSSQSLSACSPSYREADFLQSFGITIPRSRNGKLSALVGEVFHQVGIGAARRLAQAQFQAKTVATKAGESDHMESFEKLWRGLMARWTTTISDEEREKYARLESDNERDAFRIIRSYARKAKQEGASDFPIVRDNLAVRLGVTGKGAAGIRDKFVQLSILAKTANYVPNKFAARFKWLPFPPS